MKALEDNLGRTTYSVTDQGSTVLIRRQNPSERYPTEIHVPRRLLVKWAAQVPIADILRGR